MKVFIQRPWRFADSPYYQYLINYPPVDVNYVGQNQSSGTITNRRKFALINWTKVRIKKIIRSLPFGIPNAHFSKPGNYSLIHCAHCLSLNKKPWVADIEYAEQFSASGRISENNKNKILKILLKENCKKILAWTEWSKQKILKEFPQIKNKVEVVYPAIPLPANNKKKHSDINLVFISRRFYFKGGLHALEVIDRLTKKHSNVRGIIVSNTPKEVLEKYCQNKKIKFYDVLPHEKIVKDIYPITDIFVYPSYTDTFGFAITEAMSFGIPCVCVDGHSRSEIIENEKNGLIVPEPAKWDTPDLENLETLKKTIDTIEKKVEGLIKDAKIREKMSKECVKEFKYGKFSVERRNIKLKKIYLDAIK